MKYWWVVFLLLIYTNFFGATNINNTILLGSLLPFVWLTRDQNAYFRPFIVLVFACLFLSFISCNYYRGQSIFLTFRSSAQYFYLLFYFLLIYFKPTLKTMNHAILWLTVIFCFCYLLQYIIYPTVLFRGAQEDFSHDVRIRLAGQGIVSLGFFLSLNRLLVTDRLKLKYLAIMSACVGVMILMGFRTVLLALLIISFVMVITIKGFNFRLTLYLLGFLIIGGFFSQMPFVQDKIQAMQERQETDNMSNDNYIRVLQLEYYLNEHFKDSKEFVFGSGIPALNDNGNYSKYMNILLDSGLTWVDFGLFSISWLIGIPTVLMMIWYSIMCVSKRVSVNNRFLGFWFLFLLLISFTTAEFFRSGNFVIQSVVFYYIELANKSYLFSMYEKRSKGRYTYIPSGT